MFVQGFNVLFPNNAHRGSAIVLYISGFFFPEIFRRGGIDRHALDLTNMLGYFRNHEHGLLDHVHNYITCSLRNLKGGKTAMKGEGSPSWPYVEKTLYII